MKRDPEMELLRQHRDGGATLTADALEKLSRYEAARGLDSPLSQSIADAMGDQVEADNDRAIASMRITRNPARDRMAAARVKDPATFAALPFGTRYEQLVYERAMGLEKGTQE